jgi:mono/diheme cytochrome c family protein
MERLMIDKIKDYWRLPSAKEMAAKELNEAQRKLLDALSAQEYAKRMADYHSDRIKRLTAYLKDES